MRDMHRRPMRGATRHTARQRRARIRTRADRGRAPAAPGHAAARRRSYAGTRPRPPRCTARRWRACGRPGAAVSSVWRAAVPPELPGACGASPCEATPRPPGARGRVRHGCVYAIEPQSCSRCVNASQRRAVPWRPRRRTLRWESQSVYRVPGVCTVDNQHSTKPEIAASVAKRPPPYRLACPPSGGPPSSHHQPEYH